MMIKKVTFSKQIICEIQPTPSEIMFLMFMVTFNHL